MIREPLAAFAVLAGVVLLATAAPVFAQPTPTWSASLVADSVPQGSQIVVEVIGPPNGTYAAFVYVQPFNSTPPAEAAVLALPSFANLANGSAVGELSLNTSSLGAEMVQVAVSNASAGVFGEFWVEITPGGPAIAALENQLLLYKYDLAENASRVYSLLSLQQNVKNWAIFAVSFSAITFIVEVILIVATRTAARERRLVRRLAGLAGRVMKRKRSLSWTDGWGVDNDELPRPDPRAVFIARPPLCALCSYRDRWPVIAAHLSNAHKIPDTDIPAMVQRDEEASQQVRDLAYDSLPTKAAPKPEGRPAGPDVGFLSRGG